MNIQTIQPSLIQPNPWQPRTMIDPAAIAELAESIAAQGLLQPPVARAVNSHYELAFGHRRLLAWQNAKPGEAMPLQVQELTDRQMAEFAATENAARRDLNPVERALAMKRLITEFGLTQTEAGKLFGLGSQGAVSNAMRLLHLPDEVLAHVASGALPERLARRLLVLVKHLPKATIPIAQGTAGSDDKEDTFEELFSATLHKHGKRIDYAETFGTEEEILLTLAVATWAKKLGFSEKAPVCQGCEFLVDYEYLFCARPECYNLKTTAKHEWMVAEATKGLGIPLAAPGDPFEAVFDGREEDIPWAKALIKSKHPSLRIRVDDSTWGYNYSREYSNCLSVLGHKHAILGTTIKEDETRELSKAVPKPKAEKKAAPTAASKKQQTQNSEWEKREELRAQKDRLIKDAAQVFGKLFPKDPVLLGLLIDRIALSADDIAMKTVAEKQQYVAWECISERIHDEVDYDDPLEETAIALMAMAARLKVKLPPSILEAADPPAAPAVQGAPARAGAPNPGAKKPAAKKPAGKKK